MRNSQITGCIGDSVVTNTICGSSLRRCNCTSDGKIRCTWCQDDIRQGITRYKSIDGNLVCSSGNQVTPLDRLIRCRNSQCLGSDCQCTVGVCNIVVTNTLCCCRLRRCDRAGTDSGSRCNKTDRGQRISIDETIYQYICCTRANLHTIGYALIGSCNSQSLCTYRQCTIDVRDIIVRSNICTGTVLNDCLTCNVVCEAFGDNSTSDGTRRHAMTADQSSIGTSNLSGSTS